MLALRWEIQFHYSAKRYGLTSIHSRRSRERAGRLKILINNAGCSPAGPIEEALLEEAKAQFETNVFGVVGVVKKVLPIMRHLRRNQQLATDQISEYDPWRKRASGARHKWEESLPEPTLVAERVLRIIESKSPRLAL